LKISNLFSFHLWLCPFIWTGREEWKSLSFE
jgi:hypothetical protein